MRSVLFLVLILQILHVLVVGENNNNNNNNYIIIIIIIGHCSDSFGAITITGPSILNDAYNGCGTVTSVVVKSTVIYIGIFVLKFLLISITI